MSNSKNMRQGNEKLTGGLSSSLLRCELQRPRFLEYCAWIESPNASVPSAIPILHDIGHEGRCRWKGSIFAVYDECPVLASENQRRISGSNVSMPTLPAKQVPFCSTEGNLPILIHKMCRRILSPLPNLHHRSLIILRQLQQRRDLIMPMLLQDLAE